MTATPTRTRFPRGLLWSAIGLTIVTIGLLTLSSIRSLRVLDSIEARELAIENACGRITYLDEVLTMSTRMAAATGDLRWEQRYELHVPLLDQALEDASLLAPALAAKAGNEQTSDANDRLIELELQAFDLVRAGEEERAAELISGPEYEQLKVVYAEGTELYLGAMRTSVAELLSRERRFARSVRISLLLLLPALALTWAQVWLLLGSHVKRRNEDEQKLRTQATVLRQKTSEAQEATRAKGEFLSRMSHEIRTPLNGVLGIAQVLADSELDEEQRGLVRTIVGSGQLLEALLNDILDASKIEAGKLTITPTPCDLRRIVSEVVGVLRQRAITKDLALEGTVAQGVAPLVVLDPTRIRQILLNLTGNAIKFTASGQVTIHVGEGRSTEELVLTVSDTGMGIPEDRLESIFEDFVQADDSISSQFGGTGLGLSICRQLTELMGGSLEVTSTVGAGTTFSLTLPAAAACSNGADSEAGESAASSALSGKVLVAEDNPVNQLVIRRLLAREGLEIELVEDGQAFLECVDPSQHDLVLMDLSMPRVGGLDATRRFRAGEPEGAHLPIVALTASAFPEDIAACRDAGMDDFLSKPLSEEQLRRVLSHWLAPDSDDDGRAAA